MALVNAYATVAEIREHLSDPLGKLDIDLLERAINAASRAVDKFCGRRFWQDLTTSDRLYFPDSGIRLYVDDFSTTFQEVRTDEDNDGVYELLWDSADFVRLPANAGLDVGEPRVQWILFAVGDKRFPVAFLRPPVQVTAQWGWSAIPDDVKYATILKAVSMFRRKDAPFGVAGFGEFGAVRITRADPDVIELLQPFVRAGMAGVA